MSGDKIHGWLGLAAKPVVFGRINSGNLGPPHASLFLGSDRTDFDVEMRASAYFTRRRVLQASYFPDCLSFEHRLVFLDDLVFSQMGVIAVTCYSSLFVAMGDNNVISITCCLSYECTMPLS